MNTFKYRAIAAALLFALTACGMGFGQSETTVEIVRFEPGMKLGEMVSRRFYEEHLSPQVRTDGEPYVATIGSPHILRMKVGSDEIELHPGGYNSMTYIHSGYSPGGLGDGTNRDYSRIGRLSTDTGSQLLTRQAARDLAIRLCAIAEKGLNAKSRLNPAQVIDNPNLSVTDHMKWIDARASEVCVVANSEATFSMRYSGPDDILSEDSPRKDEEAFRLNVTLGETLRATR